MFSFLDFRDNLAGTDVYGVYAPGPMTVGTFSIAFSQYISGPSQEFLFMSGDKSKFLITTYDQFNFVSNMTVFRNGTTSSFDAKPRL